MNRLPLKRIARINVRKLSEESDPELTFRYLDIEGVAQGALTREPEEMTFATAPSRARRLVSLGDSIVSTVRTYLRSVWTVNQASDDLVVSTGFAVVTPGPDIEPRYLGWALQSNDVIDEIVARSVGVSYPAINPSVLGSIAVPIPARREQRAIADYLDRETARLDALIEKKVEMVRLARERFSAQVVAQTSREGGPLVPIRRLVSAITTGSRDWSDLVLDGDGYFIRATNLSRHSTDPDLALEKLARLESPKTAEARRAMLQPGDVLVCVTGYPGSIAYWNGDVAPAFVSQHVAALRPAAGTLGLWMAFALLAPSVQAQIGARQYGGTKQGLGLNDLKELRVAVASPNQQAAVAAELAGAQSGTDALVADCNRQMALLREKRQALITAGVTGQIAFSGAA